MPKIGPKYILHGINFTENFFGLKTIITSVYGMAEVGLKVSPIFIAAYYLSKNLHTKIN